MYCRNCGAELNDQVHICPMSDNTPAPEVVTEPKWCVMSIVAFPLSVLMLVASTVFFLLFFSAGDIGFLVVWVLNMPWGIPLSLVCLALSIVAVCLVLKRKQRGKALAISSLVVSAISLLMSLVMICYPFIIQIVARS